MEPVKHDKLAGALNLAITYSTDKVERNELVKIRDKFIKNSISVMVVRTYELSVDNSNKLNLTKSLNLPKTYFKKRGCMEINTDYKQLIPYVVVINEDNKILTYKRSVKSGESRLHNTYSIGVGGHIDKPENTTDTKQIIQDSLIREMKEELGTSINWSEQDFQFKGTIYNNSDEVGKVHLGLLYIVKIKSKELLEEGELDIVIDRQFLTIKRLTSKGDLEAWSQFIVEKLTEIL